MQARSTPEDTPATHGAVPASGYRAWLAVAAVGGLATLVRSDAQTPGRSAAVAATPAPALDPAA
jgi:hypothetical protein